MKRIIANATLLMAVVLLFTAAGFTQQHAIKVDVPFEFNVGQKTFPAGEYRVAQVATHVLALRDGNNRFLTFVLTQPMSSDNRVTPKLRFKVEDGRHVLSEAWADGGMGYLFSVPKRLIGVVQNRPAGTEVQATTSSYTGK